MPNTPIYGLHFEDADDQPGVSLTGGSSGTEDILAEQVEAELARIDSEAADIDNRVTTVEERVFRLDQIALSGTVDSGTDLVIPVPLRGLFRSYLLEVQAGASGATPRDLVIRINGIGSSEYRSMAVGWNAAAPAIAANFASNSTSFPRIGYLGNFYPGIAVCRYRPGSLGQTGSMTWSAHGWANGGSTLADCIPWFSGGRWNGTTQDIEFFRIRTANTGDTWAANSNATLWGQI